MITIKEYLLQEAAFVSKSPSTGASNGVAFDAVKNKEKSVGEHTRSERGWNPIPAGSQYTESGFKSKKDALQHLANNHISNK